MNFEKITFERVSVLIETIVSHNIKLDEYIERSYLNHAIDFYDNFSFLSTLELIKVSSGKIIPSKTINSLQLIQNKQGKSNKLKSILLKELIQKSDNPQIHEFKDYCSKFSIDGNVIFYAPNLTNRLKYAGIRNFLMELGFVKKDYKKDVYFIYNEYNDLFIKLARRIAVLTPEALAAIQERQLELGNKAEERIIAYEKERWMDYPHITKKIAHIAKINVNAGYDIESFNKNKAEKEGFEKIYIEVKAISALQKKFYWSANEIRTARKLKLSYYLYLLPIGMNEQFDIDNLQIIQNPYESVYLSSAWLKKEELISIMEKK